MFARSFGCRPPVAESEMFAYTEIRPMRLRSSGIIAAGRLAKSPGARRSARTERRMESWPLFGVDQITASAVGWRLNLPKPARAGLCAHPPTDDNVSLFVDNIMKNVIFHACRPTVQTLDERDLATARPTRWRVMVPTMRMLLSA